MQNNGRAFPNCLHGVLRLAPATALALLAVIAWWCCPAQAATGTKGAYVIGFVLPDGKSGHEPVLHGLDMFRKHYDAELKHLLSKEFGISAPNITFSNVPSGSMQGISGEPHSETAEHMAQSPAETTNVVALMGNPSSDNEYVDHKFYNENRIPLIALASSEPNVTRKSPWVFSMIYTDEC
ncbi:MAG: hypothetical protein V2B18_01580, partial [Pseudomonadota bacterium]